MEKVKYPSLELNWLPNSLLKGISLPKIVISDTEGYSGAYYLKGCPYEEFGYNNLKHGIIEISTCGDYLSTLIHEWRHHWQRENGWNLGGFDWNSGVSYKKSIIKYFTTLPHEMDALKFEIKYAPSDLNLSWWDWIQNANRNNRN